MFTIVFEVRNWNNNTIKKQAHQTRQQQLQKTGHNHMHHHENPFLPSETRPYKLVKWWVGKLVKSSIHPLYRTAVAVHQNDPIIFLWRISILLFSSIIFTTYYWSSLLCIIADKVFACVYGLASQIVVIDMGPNTNTYSSYARKGS